MNHIVIIGFMGSGKTRVGKRLAKNRITVYNFNHDYSIEEYSFTDTVKAGIYEDLSIDFSEINIL